MLSEKPWSVEGAARLFFGVIATLCIGLVLTGLAQNSFFGLNPNQARFAGELIMVLFFHVGAMLWVASFLKEESLSWDQAFGIVSSPRGRAIFLGVITGAIFLPLAWGLQQISALVMTWLHWTPVAQHVVEELQTTLPLYRRVFFGFLAIIVAPIAEETLFRGVLYPTLKQTGKKRMALWVTSILFGLSHVNAVTFLPLLAFSVLLILLYEETDNLLAPIVAHSIFNTTNFVFLLIGGGR